MNKKNAKVCLGALIAASYVVLNLVSAALGLAFGHVQLRLSEMLTLLPAFTPAAVSGLTIGCFLSNLASPNIADLFVGTAATLLAAVLTRILRKFTIHDVPWLAPLPPVIINSVFVGLELSFIGTGGFNPVAFAAFSLQIAAGQIFACYILGLPLCMFLKKRIDKIDFNQR